ISGRTPVVVNGSASDFGQGWSLAGLDRLVSVTGGVLYVYGSGGARFFALLGAGAFLSPPHDFRALTPVGTPYTYTAKDQVQRTFDSGGKLTKVTDPHGLALTYAYSGGRLATITGPDGGVGTFSYDGSGKLNKVQEPGGRTVTVTVNGAGDLTS